MNTLETERVVQRQLDAYNARDVETLIRVYAEDAQMFGHPSKLLASGSTELRQRFHARFAEPDLHATLLRRMVMGHMVVDHEEVTRNFPERERQNRAGYDLRSAEWKDRQSLEHCRPEDAGRELVARSDRQAM